MRNVLLTALLIFFTTTVFAEDLSFHMVDYRTEQKYVAISKGDFDADGKADMVAVSSYTGGPGGGGGIGGVNAVSVYLSKPGKSGRFAKEELYLLPADATGVATGDFNNDGNVDMAASLALGSNNLFILLGNGDGTFLQPVGYDTGIYPFSIISADFNNDGIIDIATANRMSSSISILLGHGDGTFPTHVEYQGRGVKVS